ncbi:MAG: hypothetical protein ACE5G2_12795, partial [Candidatus Krumholzibacteriia bacterium]
VHILPEDAGMNLLFARLTYDAADGSDIVQTAVDTFWVQEQQQSFDMVLAPNPARGDLSAATLAVDLEWPAEVRIEIYNLEGELVSSRLEHVEPFIQSPKPEKVRILSSATTPTDLVSGTDFVRVRLSGLAGQSASTMLRWVVIQ